MAKTPARPVKEELARPDSALLLGSGFTNLLTIDDSVLEARGRDYRIYREVLRDDQCASTFAQRRLAVTAREWDVDPASDSALDKAAADFLREQLKALEWDRITDKMLYARWYGHAVGECLWDTDGQRVVLADVKVRDRSRFLYDDQGGLYLQKPGAGKPVRMPERKFWTISTGADTDESPYGLGLAHFCYWPVFFKRNDIKFWLVFLEKFGMPTALGKAPAGRLEDKAFRDRVLAALRAISSETAVLAPEGVEIELLEAARGGASDYDTMRKAMDAAVAKIVIGQTASSEGTPGRLGNDDLQGDVRLDLIKADADLVCESFNRQVARWLTEWNFPGAGVPKVWRKTEPEEDMKERAERDAKIYALGFEPTEEYVRDTYGDGWQKRAMQSGLTPEQVTGQLAQEFAEVGAIATLKAGQRADQQSIHEAAVYLANRYQDVLGPRVQQLLDYAEETGDYETMGKRVLELIAEPPPRAAQQAIMRAGVFARLMGRLRAQR